MGERHPAFEHYEQIRAAEEARIKRIANPAERVREFLKFKQWSREELERVQNMVNNRVSTVVDLEKDSKYV